MFLEAYLGTYSKEMPIASNDIFSAIMFWTKKIWEISVFQV
jgi:hypothetical protein